METEETKTAADFWLDKTPVIFVSANESVEGPLPSGFSRDLILLSAYRRVISNFVCILTNKSIPVHFSCDANASVNCTDGKRVWISASVKRKSDFDWSVGLALHEAAHIKLSDFDIVKKVFGTTPLNLPFPIKMPIHLKQLATQKNLTLDQLLHLSKTIFNVVEDRYIDSFVFNEAPGYRGYYKALYEKLWNSEDISKAVSSEYKRLPNLTSYEFRIINLTNPNTDLDALPGLRKIAEILDMSNILRLKKTEERLDISYKIVEIILENIQKSVKEAEQSTFKKASEVIKKHTKAGGTATQMPSKEPAAEEDEEFEPAGDPSLIEDETEGKGGSVGNSPGESEPEDLDEIVGEHLAKDKEPEPLSPYDEGNTKGFTKQSLKKLREEIQKQENVLTHDFNDIKEKLDKSDAAILDVIERYGIVLIPTGQGFIEKDKPSVDCIVVHKLTKELIGAGKDVFPLSCGENIPGAGQTEQDLNTTAVHKGFTLGKMLGKKLQIRGETTIIKFIRKISGKIERRLLAGIGAGQTDIFNKVHIHKYNRIRLHISVDASDSMNVGEKWRQTITSVTAICVAASMVENLLVSVSFRCTHGLSDGVELPYVVLGYDSEVDKISKIKQLFPLLRANGGTPEGLAFEAIMDKFIIGKRTDEQEHYFLNLSDGEPCFRNFRAGERYLDMDYVGDAAADHTRAQVNKIRSQGVRVLSYFINAPDFEIGGLRLLFENRNKELKQQFSRMYGKDASFIDVNNVFEIAKTINRLFINEKS